MNADNTHLNCLSEKVLGAVFEVPNTLDAGFLEKLYRRALLKGYSAAQYFADLLVENVLAVELKCVERLAHEHTA